MHILAMSGGYSTPIEKLAFDLTKKDKARVLILPTATYDHDAGGWFYMSNQDRIEDASRLRLSVLPPEVTPTELDKWIQDFDLIYIPGGNTVHLLREWRRTGLHHALKNFHARENTVLIGESAGALCWFKYGITDSLGPGLNHFDLGLGFAPGGFTPHANHSGRRDRFRDWVQERGIEGIALDDNAVLHIEGDKIKECLTTKSGATGHRVKKMFGKARVFRMKARLLGSQSKFFNYGLPLNT